jgi:multiple sugar transport system permease protein
MKNNRKKFKKFTPLNILITLFMTTVLMMIFIPLLYFISVAFSSANEVTQFPLRVLPRFTVEVQVSYIDNATDENYGKYRILIREGDSFEPAFSSRNALEIEEYFEKYLSVTKSGEDLLSDFETTRFEGAKVFKYSKNLWYNFKSFFRLTENGVQSLINSILVAMLTILISVTLGSCAGYAIARYRFKGKEKVSMALLFVRMFPIVTISLPMAVLLIRFNLYDSLLGLAIVYSIPNVALTTWITSGIFRGINPELEEASWVFGAGKLQTFLRITLPLTFPAIAASSMYAFTTAWNDTITALILTNRNSTLALAVYKAIGSGTSDIQFAAAGSIILILPALVYTFVMRRYIGQMWGSSTVK